MSLLDGFIERGTRFTNRNTYMGAFPETLLVYAQGAGPPKHTPGLHGGHSIFETLKIKVRSQYQYTFGHSKRKQMVIQSRKLPFSIDARPSNYWGGFISYH
jgi:hypothetical protein